MDEELRLVSNALLRLDCSDPARWGSNHRAWLKWPYAQRYRWWVLAKRQADKGVPSMQRLVVEVVAQRLKS